jgi:hypothetical protein
MGPLAPNEIAPRGALVCSVHDEPLAEDHTLSVVLSKTVNKLFVNDISPLSNSVPTVGTLAPGVSLDHVTPLLVERYSPPTPSASSHVAATSTEPSALAARELIQYPGVAEVVQFKPASSVTLTYGLNSDCRYVTEPLRQEQLSFVGTNRASRRASNFYLDADDVSTRRYVEIESAGF